MVSSVADVVAALMSVGGRHGCWSVAAFLPHVVLFSVAFGYWKCYHSVCFKESDSWDEIFDIGGSR
jgi:hypothetical protein